MTIEQEQGNPGYQADAQQGQREREVEAGQGKTLAVTQQPDARGHERERRQHPQRGLEEEVVGQVAIVDQGHGPGGHECGGEEAEPHAPDRAHRGGVLPDLLAGARGHAPQVGGDRHRRKPLAPQFFQVFLDEHAGRLKHGAGQRQVA